MLSIAVQHHPRRADILPALLDALAPAEAEVVADPEPNAPLASPWRTYRRALELTPARASHRLILQDDALPCRDFAAAAERALAARPGTLVVFCVCGLPRRAAMRIHRAAELGYSWVRLDRGHWVPAIAVAWPAELIEPALAFVDGKEWPPSFRSDDEIIGRIATGLALSVLATAPSLVEHPDVVPSLLRRKAAAGANPNRVAASFIGAGDALAIDWQPGPR